MEKSVPETQELIDYIQTLKDKSGLTMQGLADLSGIPKSTLENFFTGATREPRFSLVATLVKTLGGSLDDLTGIPRLHDTEIRTVQVPDPDHIKKDYITEMLTRLVKPYDDQIAGLRRAVKFERREKWIVFAIAVVLFAINTLLLFDCLTPSWGMFSVR